MMQVDRIVQIDAGKDGEDIGLQNGNADFKPGQRHDEGQRRPARQNAERDDKAAEYFQHGMAGHHIGEQPNRQADGTRQIAQQLDDDQKRQQENRYARGHEQLQEMGPVANESDDGDTQEDDGGHDEGHDDVAGHREAEGHHPDQIAEQDEHEQREDEGEIAHPVAAHVVAHHLGHELVGELDHRLQSTGTKPMLAEAQGQQRGHQRDRDEHEDGGIGDRHIDAADVDLVESLYFELFERA